MAEQDPVKVKVVGSSPTPGAKKLDTNSFFEPSHLQKMSSYLVSWLRTLNEIRTFFSENPNAEFWKTFKLGRAKRKGVGGKEFLPALAFPPPPNFVFRFAKCAAKEDVALAPALPCAGNDKELPFCLPNFNIFDTIVLSKLIYTQYK